MNLEDAKPEAKRWLTFTVGGGLNTVFTYGLYLTFRTILSYQAAYLVAYVFGILFAYWFNARFVFRAPMSWKGLFAYPLVYIVQYGLSALVLAALAEYLHVPTTYAPLLVTVIVLPLTYTLNKLLLTQPRKKLPSDEKCTGEHDKR